MVERPRNPAGTCEFFRVCISSSLELQRGESAQLNLSDYLTAKTQGHGKLTCVLKPLNFFSFLSSLPSDWSSPWCHPKVHTSSSSLCTAGDPHCSGGGGTLCKCLLFFSLYRLFLRTDQTPLRLAQCCPYLPSLLVDLLSPFLLIRRGGGRWAPHDWIGLWFMFSPCMYICHMWVCHIYVPTNLSTLFQISTQIGILSFFFFFFFLFSN